MKQLNYDHQHYLNINLPKLLLLSLIFFAHKTETETENFINQRLKYLLLIFKIQRIFIHSKLFYQICISSMKHAHI